jgi:general stress protein 26
MRDAEKTIGNLIDKQGTVYVSSVDSDGYPNTKAMNSPRKRVGIREFYFSTNTSSMRVDQYRKYPKACIYFCDKRFYRGVMLKGTMEVLEDEESKEAIWLPGDTMYYPKGVTDPDYCVLRFTVQEGRYYSNFKSETFSVSVNTEQV